MGHYGHYFGGRQVIANLLTLALIVIAMLVPVVAFIVAYNLAEAYKTEDY